MDLGEPAAQHGDQAEEDRAAEGAAQQLRDSLGDGQGAINRLQQIAAALESTSGDRILVIVERFAELLGQMDNATLAQALEILETRLLVHISQQNAMLIFIGTNRRAITRFIEPERTGILWHEIPPPAPAEITEALVRVARRRGFDLRDPKAVGVTLGQNKLLRDALGVPARVVRLNRPVSLHTVLDLPPVDEQRVAAVLDELDALTGLAEVKAQARAVVASARARRLRLEKDGIFPDETMHLVFAGGAGTGKTTVARIIARLYHALGVLPSDRVIDVKPIDFGSPTVGETGVNMHALLTKALGGVLFIDEAHTLADDRSFGGGQEAIDVIVPFALDHRDNLVIILAGYSDKIPNVLRMNQGLPRRFPLHGRFEFADYTSGELWEILERKLANDHWILAPEAVPATKRVLERRAAGPGFGNAGGVGTFIEELVRNHDSGADPESRVLSSLDLPPTIQRHESVLFEAQAQLDGLVGLDAIRRRVHDIIEDIAYDAEEGRSFTGLRGMQFVGPPGTGKTTVARLMADLLFGHGILASNKFVEVAGAALRAGYVGQTAGLVNDLVLRAQGGVLFIDEAYGIMTSDHDDFGRDALDTLMQQVLHPDNSGTLFILAGYEGELARLMARNPGMPGRFPTMVRFVHFAPEDCAEVARRMLASSDYTWDEEAIEALGGAALAAIHRDGQTFQNARWVELTVDEALKKMKARVRRDLIPVGDPGRRELRLVDVQGSLGDTRPEPLQPVQGTHPARLERGAGTTTPERTTSVPVGTRTILNRWDPAPEYALLASEPADDSDPSEWVASLTDTVLHLVVDGPAGRGAAAGFMITPDGLAVTNAHVIQSTTSIEALMGPERGSAAARIVMVDEDLDLAILAVAVPADRPIDPLPLGRSMGLPLLSEVIVVGQAQVMPGDPARVIVARIARNHGLDDHFFETDGAIEQGFSGGPVFDPAQGAVVGVVVAGRGETVKLMIRIERVREMLQELGYRFEEV